MSIRDAHNGLVLALLLMSGTRKLNLLSPETAASMGEVIWRPVPGDTKSPGGNSRQRQVQGQDWKTRAKFCG